MRAADPSLQVAPDAARLLDMALRDIEGMPVEMNNPVKRMTFERVSCLRPAFDALDERVSALQQQLTEQRAELTGGLSELFRSLPACYDTPVDHYREMARRLVDDRDALKHRSRELTTERDAALGCAEALAGMYEAMKAERDEAQSERDREIRRTDIVIAEFDAPWPHSHTVGEVLADRLVQQIHDCRAGTENRAEAAEALAVQQGQTITSIATMLGWGNVPSQDVLERDINALKARAKEAGQQGQALTALRAGIEALPKYIKYDNDITKSVAHYVLLPDLLALLPAAPGPETS